MQKPSKNHLKKERRKQKEKEMNQLANLTSIKPVYYNSPVEPKHLTKEQTAKEIRVRQWMDLQSINYIANPFKSKKGNMPVSTFNKLQTEHQVQKEKCTCTSITDYEKKNTRYKFNHGVDMPVKRVSATAGMKQVSWLEGQKKFQAINNRDIDKIDEKNPVEKETDDRIKHELK